MHILGDENLDSSISQRIREQITYLKSTKGISLMVIITILQAIGSTIVVQIYGSPTFVEAYLVLGFFSLMVFLSGLLLGPIGGLLSSGFAGVYGIILLDILATSGTIPSSYVQVTLYSILCIGPPIVALLTALFPIIPKHPRFVYDLLGVIFGSFVWSIIYAIIYQISVYGVPFLWYNFSLIFTSLL